MSLHGGQMFVSIESLQKSLLQLSSDMPYAESWPMQVQWDQMHSCHSLGCVSTMRHMMLKPL